MGTNYINTRLAQMGANTGVGLALGGAAAAAPDVKLAEAIGAGHAEASRRAMEILQARANAEMLGGAQRPMWQDMLGGSIAAAIPYVLDKTKAATTAKKPGETAAQAAARARIEAYGAQPQQQPTYGGTLYPIANPNTIAAAHGVTPGQYIPTAYSPYKPKPWSPPSWKGFQPDQPVFADNYDWTRRRVQRARAAGIPRTYGAFGTYPTTPAMTMQNFPWYFGGGY